MDTHTMGMKLTLAYCMQAAGYKFEPLDPDCEKLMDTGNPSCWLGAIEDPCGGRQATIEPQASSAKQPIFSCFSWSGSVPSKRSFRCSRAFSLASASVTVCKGPRPM